MHAELSLGLGLQLTQTLPWPRIIAWLFSYSYIKEALKKNISLRSVSPRRGSPRKASFTKILYALCAMYIVTLAGTDTLPSSDLVRPGWAKDRRQKKVSLYGRATSVSVAKLAS